MVIRLEKELEDNIKIKFYVNKIEEKLNFFIENWILSLIIIGVVSFLFRMLFFDSSILIKQDAVAYFWHANDIAFLKEIIPIYHNNNGWSMFLSFFFSMFHYENFLEYSILQQLISVSVSVLTIIPIYYLGKRFFEKSFALMVVILFTFEPHLIQNSLLGLTEPLFIFLITSTLALFLTSHKKWIFISFSMVGLCTIVRTEGIVLLPILIIMLIVRFRKEKMFVKDLIISILAFSIVLGSIMIVNLQISQDDGFSGRIIGMTVGSINVSDGTEELFNNLEKADVVFVKRIGQSLIPYFGIFVPFGIFLVLKNRKEKNNLLIILATIVFLIVAFRIFFIAYDLRYIFSIYPLLCIISVFTIRHIGDNIEFKRIFLIGIIGAILLLSWFFLYSNTEYDYQKEVIQFANYMVSNVKVSNNFYPESGYIYGVWASSNLKFPILSSDAEYTGPDLLDYVKGTNFVYLAKSANSVEEYIELARDQNLSHLVIDNNEKRQSYFRDIFYYEEKYPYLIKEFDSAKEGYRYYNVKVFKIDYEYFDSKLKDN